MTRGFAPVVSVMLVILAASWLSACGGDSGTRPTGQLVTVGRLERGATIRVTATGGATIADSLVTNLTVTPSSAGTVTGATVKLLEAGSLVLSATASDGRTVSAQIQVVAPPTLFFDATAAGNRDIYSVALDGRDLKRWTTAPAEDSHPSVAGALLVFSSTRDGNGELYSLSTSSGAPGAERRLTTTAVSETDPTLSNGASTIAYLSDVEGVPRILVSPIAVTTTARLTASSFGFGGSIETGPTWSPAGDRIALVSTTNGRANLFITSSTPGSTPTAVAGSGLQQTDVEPAWSPDGRQILFASTRAGGTVLFLLELSSGVYTRVPQVTDPSGQPAWLPDGRIVYRVVTGNESTLWWIDPAGSAPPVEIPTGTRSAAHPTGVRP